MAALLLESEVAERLRLTKPILYHMRRRGDGPPYARLGRTIVYDLEALERWLHAQTQHAKPAGSREEADVHA